MKETLRPLAQVRDPQCGALHDTAISTKTLAHTQPLPTLTSEPNVKINQGQT
jgi:hypothetical protein